jgi:hypothetical protein
MKCIKNNKTGNILRVENKQAEQMVGITWSYVSKDEWRKSQSLDNQEVTVSHDMGGPIIEKKSKKTSKKVSK